MKSSFFFYLIQITFLGGVFASNTKLFGDSILASNTPIIKDLEEWAGVEIQDYATIGAGLLDGWVTSIPTQYEKNKYPIPSTIIMDGGGNDINSVRSECQAFTNSCIETVNRLVGIAKDLLATMRKDGVKDIIYSGFYYIPGFERVIDYGVTQLQTVCLPKEHCYFVDLRNVSVHVGWDGMHPLTESYHDIAKEIWNVKTLYNITID